MDSDEYDDDIADEDLIVAASQAPASHGLTTTGPNLNRHHDRSGPHARKPPFPGNSFNSRNVAPRVRSGPLPFLPPVALRHIPSHPHIS